MKPVDEKKKLPIGIEKFEKIRKEGFYYTDKTGLIRELLQNWGEVNLFTRPRRFGKSLNMSMLKSFFEIGAKKELFDGLAISGEHALCERYMGKFPVISVTFKGIVGADFQTAKGMLRYELKREAERYQLLADSDRLTETDKRNYFELLRMETQETVMVSLALLSRLLYKHFGKKTLILIDEYDVPLAKAQQSGYYEEAYRICRQGLTDCFKTGFLYAVPELILQLSILCQYMGNPAQAESFYFLGSVLFQWSRHKTVPYTLYELMEQDFLLYYE